MALALTRNLGESIVIGNAITVSVARVVGTKVVLAIEASQDIPVHRSEIQELVREEMRQAGLDPMMPLVMSVRAASAGVADGTLVADGDLAVKAMSAIDRALATLKGEAPKQ